MIRVGWIGLVVGFLLNLTGWVGNNFLLHDLWRGVGANLEASPWRDSPWRDVLSLAPDFLYGIAIAWLFVALRPSSVSRLSASLRSGLFVSLVGGITTYFAIANSGFIPWQLAWASFALVIGTKLPLALLAGRWLDRPQEAAPAQPQV